MSNRGIRTESWNELAEYGRERDALLQRIVLALEADSRASAVWLSGSFGREEDDDWSDLDLHVAVEDEHLAGFLAEREDLYRRVGSPILIQQEMPSHSQPGARFQLVLYPGPFEVDWNIGSRSEAQRPLAYRMLVERADVPIVSPSALTSEERRAQLDHWLTFFWAMAPIAVKYCGRADTRRAVGQIGLLSTAFIALWRLIHQPNGPNPMLAGTNRILEPELDAQLPQLGSTVDPLAALAVIQELCIQVEAFHPEFMVLGVEIPSGVPPEVKRLAALAEEVVGHGDMQGSKYR